MQGQAVAFFKKTLRFCKRIRPAHANFTEAAMASAKPSKPIPMSIELQLFWLFTLAIPVACISWTVTHEEVFREPREYCVNNYKKAHSFARRKFFYLFTCEYCFSHYIAILFLWLSGFRLLLEDWRGIVIAGFALVFVANVYMSAYALLRQTIKKEKTEISEIRSRIENEHNPHPHEKK